MQKRNVIAAMALAALLVGGTTNVVAVSHDTPENKVQRMIDAADAARKKAASVGGEWRDTGKMIKKAQKMLKAGDLGKAAKMANKAKKQGELGYAQAMSQKTVKMPSYLVY